MEYDPMLEPILFNSSSTFGISYSVVPHYLTLEIVLPDSSTFWTLYLGVAQYLILRESLQGNEMYTTPYFQANSRGWFSLKNMIPPKYQWLSMSGYSSSRRWGTSSLGKISLALGYPWLWSTSQTPTKWRLWCFRILPKMDPCVCFNPFLWVWCSSPLGDEIWW